MKNSAIFPPVNGNVNGFVSSFPSVRKEYNGFENKENQILPSLVKKPALNPLRSFPAFLKDQDENPNCLKCLLLKPMRFLCSSVWVSLCYVYLDFKK